MIKPILFQDGKEVMLQKLIKYLAYNLNMRLSPIFGINQDPIQIYNHKNIKLFC